MIVDDKCSIFIAAKVSAVASIVTTEALVLVKKEIL